MANAGSKGARSRAVKASRALSGIQCARLLQRWEVLLAQRVGTVVGRSIFDHALSLCGMNEGSLMAHDVPRLLDILTDSASVYLSKKETEAFAEQLADAAESGGAGGT